MLMGKGRYRADMPRGRPGGTVTFLFTSIDDVTRPRDEASSDTAAALRVHDTIVRGTIERHGGYVFGIGDDGFSAAFSSAADAVTAAIDAQEQLRDEHGRRLQRPHGSAHRRRDRT